MSAQHEKLLALVEANQNPVSRVKDGEAPRVETTATWLAALKARYAKQPPQPFPVVTERKYQTMSEDLDAPVPPPVAHVKFARMVRR